jgi:hypothetical protein
VTYRCSCTSLQRDREGQGSVARRRSVETTVASANSAGTGPAAGNPAQAISMRYVAMRFAVRFLRHQGLSIPWRMIANQSAKIGVSIERDEDGNAAADILMLKVLLSDGSIAATGCRIWRGSVPASAWTCAGRRTACCSDLIKCSARSWLAPSTPRASERRWTTSSSSRSAPFTLAYLPSASAGRHYRRGRHRRVNAYPHELRDYRAGKTFSSAPT